MILSGWWPNTFDINLWTNNSQTLKIYFSSEWLCLSFLKNSNKISCYFYIQGCTISLKYKSGNGYVPEINPKAKTNLPWWNAQLTIELIQFPESAGANGGIECYPWPSICHSVLRLPVFVSVRHSVFPSVCICQSFRPSHFRFALLLFTFT